MAKKNIRTSLLPDKRTGIYRLRWKPVGGKWQQKSLGTKDPEKAEQDRQNFIDRYVPDESDQIAILKAQLARMEGEKAEQDAQANLLLENIWRAFMDSTDRAPIREVTLCSYIAFWKGEKGIMPWMKKNGIHSLADFTNEHAGEYIKFLAGIGVSRQTAGKYITFFRRLWDTVAPQTESPWKRKRAQGFGGKVGKKPFTLDHQRAIVRHVDIYIDGIDRRGKYSMPMEEREQAKIEYKALNIIEAYTGLRQADACKLRIEEVHFDRGVIELAPQKTRHRGDNPMYAKIGIHPTLGIVLRTLLKGRSSGYFMPYVASEYERDKSLVSKRQQAIIKGATGLELTVKPPGRARAVAVYGAHSHRKALADRLREAGVDVMVRMQIMGHKDNGGMTQEYSHVSDKEVVEALVKSMPDLLKRDGIMEAIA